MYEDVAQQSAPSETASEDEDDVPAQANTEQQIEKPAPVAPPASKKLGVIGGKKNPPTSESDKSEVAIPDNKNDASSVPAPKKSKLGVIGGQSRAATTRSHDASNEPSNKQTKGEVGKFDGIKTEEKTMEVRPSSSSHRSRADTPEKKEDVKNEPTDESPKHRADRRRMELKRELEAKASAPTKKKRRF